MKNKIIRTAILLIIFLIGTNIAFANVIWPGIYLAEGIIKYYIIIINSIITILFVKNMVKESSNIKIFVVSVILMLILTLAGMFIIPISGIVGELAFMWLEPPTFGVISWFIEYVFSVLAFTLIDDMVIKIAFKLPYKKSFSKVFLYNMVTVGMAMVEVLLIHSYRTNMI